MSSRSTEQKNRLREVASVANAEAFGTFPYWAHVGLLTFGCMAAFFMFDIGWLASISVAYILTFTLEKSVAQSVSEKRISKLYSLVLGLLVLRALLYNCLILSVWSLDGDIFKMAALALVVAATINIFVFHATYPRIIACVATPIWFGFAALAVLFYLEFHLSQETVAAALIFVALSLYLGLAVLQANKTFKEVEDTRNALSQSQKQEALGNLVSGIAHDFNNILAVTLGNAELMKNASPQLKEELAKEIIDASERGASLTSQLLAFGRRSRLSPARHSVSRVFENLRSVITRVLPEHIEVTFSAKQDTPLVFVDRHQLDTALFNLAINARDAMPDGGKLSFHASRYIFDDTTTMAEEEKISHGTYACIRATDTGIGVARDLQNAVFDPFFTTKSVGEGSGLGLSMVLGFVKQSGGFVRFESKPQIGTTVSLFLPSSPGRAEIELPQATPHLETGEGQILLVEDEAALRDLFEKQLASAGYEVTTASRGDEARHLLNKGLRPDILVTDLIMPGKMQGLELAKLARDMNDDLSIVLLSGYQDSDQFTKEPLASAVTLLAKPFSREALLSAVAKSRAKSD